MSLGFKLLWTFLEGSKVSFQPMKAALWNKTPLGAQHYVNRTSGMQGLRGILHQWSLTLCFPDEKLLCGLLKEPWVGSISGDLLCCPRYFGPELLIFPIL